MIASYLIARPIAPYLEANYGINPIVALWLFIGAEVLFDLGIVMMLWFGGVRRITWEAVRRLKVKNMRADVRHPGVLIGLILNRLSWTVPFLYIIVAGWGRLPWLITAAAAAEIAITLWIGAMALGIVSPRPKRDPGKVVAAEAKSDGVDQ